MVQKLQCIQNIFNKTKLSKYSHILSLGTFYLNIRKPSVRKLLANGHEKDDIWEKVWLHVATIIKWWQS